MPELSEKIEESGYNRPRAFPRFNLVFLALLIPILKINGHVLENLVEIKMRIIFLENHTLPNIQ